MTCASKRHAHKLRRSMCHPRMGPQRQMHQQRIRDFDMTWSLSRAWHACHLRPTRSHSRRCVSIVEEHHARGEVLLQSRRCNSSANRVSPSGSRHSSKPGPSILNFLNNDSKRSKNVLYDAMRNRRPGESNPTMNKRRRDCGSPYSLASTKKVLVS